ncbi:DUF6194 family protein [Streptosporangium sp. NPDC004379]|uniref:DUF6194 family protein n=1 Tax=Streptosporangium sp. NPDC004379 TaxID=3366189 RepID=UPI0036B53DF8
MTMDEIIDFVSGLEGVLAVRPQPGDGTPELVWGDAFFYYSPDGVVPTTVQPFATIVTKNYPEDETSRLERPGAFRVNVAAGREAFVHWSGHAPREPGPAARSGADSGPGGGTRSGGGEGPGGDGGGGDAEDTVIAHPLYGAQSWLAVVNPGPRTARVLRELLSQAHRLARARYERRAAAG